MRRRTKLRVELALLALCGGALAALIGFPDMVGETDPSIVPAASPHAVDPLALERVNNVLAVPEGGSVERERMVADLVAIGRSAIPVVAGMLCGDVQRPVAAAGQLTGAIDRKAIESWDQVLRSALQGLDAGAVAAHLLYRARLAPLGARLIVIDLLGSIDGDGALEAIVVLCNGAEPSDLTRALVTRPIESALASQLDRRHPAWNELYALTRTFESHAVPLYVGALGRYRSAAAVELLAYLIGRDEALDLAIARAFAEFGGESSVAVSDETLQSVRRLLAHSDPTVRRAAAAALGRLRDEGAVEVLIGLLEAEDELIAHSAHAALASISQLDLGPTAGGWASWLEAERAWYGTSFPAAVERIDGEQPGEVLAALNELLRHPIYRHESAAAIAVLVERDDEAVAREACRALVALRSPRAFGALIAALDSPEKCPAAHAALQAMTALRLPAQAQRWRQALAR